MQVIFYYFLFFGGIWLLSFLFSKLRDFIDKKREETRNRVANEILANKDIENIIQNYKDKLNHIKHIRVDSTNIALNELKEHIWGQNAVLLTGCPKCKDGNLTVRNGEYGKFLGCTNYPRCDYTKNIKKAREEYKKTINKQLIKDIQRAYN
ncbi:MAG: topoisomerase DNA-binding C4 zinc finger domain-containing protein [Candidatus Pacebacteria bacterium]|nr:topoisomerase DNA-binding C4 zinc finger domain-containing protein [Candidatus Paceibacterota bacterium]